MINYVLGDATNPIISGPKILIHVCNDAGFWGRGFVLSLSRKWKAPEYEYRKAALSGDLELGYVQFIKVLPDLYVANMIAQHGIKSADNLIPIRYDALKQCLVKVRNFILKKQDMFEQEFTVHGPRFGAGLAGGDWSIIEQLVNEVLSDFRVFIYDLPR